MKRRGRPFNHTPECNERQADFRARIRKIKILPLDGTSSVLDPSIGTTPLLPGTSVIAEPSSSSSVVVSHPMAVDSVRDRRTDLPTRRRRTWLEQPSPKDTASSLVGRRGVGMSEGCL